MHEIGHHMNFNYRISDMMKAQDPAAWDEMGRLALGRSAVDEATLRARHPDYLAYLMNDEERVANFFHAYWYAPDMLRRIAPNADRFVRDWLAQPGNKALKGVVDNVRPSLQQMSEERFQQF